MATRTSTTIFFANDSDAHFRAWAQEINDALTAFGWVKSTETGEINLTTVTKPSAANTAQGFQVWKMADSLQASFPVFMKIEYGSGDATNDPAVWITLGTGSNGSGTLTGTLSTRRIYGGVADTARANNYFSSGDTNRFCMAWGSDAAATSATRFLYVGIERLKNADGTDANTGSFVMGIGGDATDGAFRAQVAPFSGSVPPQQQNGPVYPQDTTTVSMIFGGTTYTLPIYPFGFFPLNPIMNFCGYLNPDFTREVAVTLSVYGANHTYLPLGTGGANFTITGASAWPGNASGTGSAYRAMMRYE